MRSSKAEFETRDPGNPFASSDTDPAYKGPERRKEHRRSGQDRRGEVRFDLTGDRRQKMGRRADDANVNYW